MARKTAKLQSNKTILIIVEGKTEQIYFSEMKSSERIPGITIIPKLAKHSALEHILNLALEEKKQQVYDSIWCVFDRDTIPEKISKEMENKITKAKDNEINFADSLPSFEIWFLLHYKKPKLHYKDQKELIKDLKNHIIDYKKEQKWLNQKKLYSKLKELHNIAMKNSEALDKQRRKQDSLCNVYKLFQEIQKLKKINTES